MFSRTDFETGNVFCLRTHSLESYYVRTNTTGPDEIINNHNKTIYAYVLYVTDTGFVAIKLFFGQNIRMKISFTNCIKWE